MGNPLYLAMTATEFFAFEDVKAPIAWMACHFSPYGKGLSNIPNALPPGSILIINDRIEPTCHDAALIAAQAADTAERLECGGILLDFQRPDSSLTAQIAATITATLPCPVAVSHHYAREVTCAVFLPPPPLRRPLTEHFAPWNGREVWMEAYDQWETVTVTENATSVSEETPDITPELPLWDDALHCHYKIDVLDDRAVFTLSRGLEELRAIPFSISNFVGLYQEYGR